MEPITFRPLYKERVWGGRKLERLYGRSLPASDKPFGESWEIVDREGDQSVVAEGPHAGKSLHDLWNTSRTELFGAGYESKPRRFPILIKVLDACDDLSVQVHPPEDLAKEDPEREPKTEMWYVADCDPGAKLYVGLKNQVTRGDFERAIAAGTVPELLHVIHPEPGESIFIPSGRLHAIGAGFLIHEIQQNSDTTYRVSDWNRLGLDGQPRELHVEESLASIDFEDFEPTMDPAQGEVLAACEHFVTSRLQKAAGEMLANPDGGHFSIISVVSGSLQSTGGRMFASGSFLMLPVSASPLTAVDDAVVLQITLPR